MNSDTGGIYLKPTSSSSETLPFRSGSAPRAWSTTTTREYSPPLKQGPIPRWFLCEPLNSAVVWYCFVLSVGMRMRELGIA